MHLACYTQEQIAEAVGMTSQGVGKVLKQIPNLEFVSNLGDFSNIAALASVDLSKGGAGKKGGLREYARRVGRDIKTISEWLSAGAVSKSVGIYQQLFDRTYTLPRSTPRRKSSGPCLSRLQLKHRYHNPMRKFAHRYHNPTQAEQFRQICLNRNLARHAITLPTFSAFRLAP